MKYVLYVVIFIAVYMVVRPIIANILTKRKEQNDG